MNRNIFTTILWLAAGAASVAVAQNSDSGAAPARVSLEILLTQKNIFDPTRSGRIRISSRPRAVVIRSFTFGGAVDDDVAFFSGDGVGKGYLGVGDMLNGFKVMKIIGNYNDPMGDPSVKLTDPTGAIVVLKKDESMRREDEGSWKPSDLPAPAPMVMPDTKVDESTTSSSPAAAPAEESEVLKRLRLKREQEDK